MLALLIFQQLAGASRGSSDNGLQGDIQGKGSQVVRTELFESIPLGPIPQKDQSYQAFENYNQPICQPSQAGSSNEWTILPDGLIYHSYLAGAKESRFRSVWSNEKDEGNIWDITLGGRVGLLRYGRLINGRPTGWQLDMEGAGQLRLDRDENIDLMASDFRFGVPLTWGDEFYQVKFGYYHLSSHVGDEFLLKNPGFPRLNFSRDVLLWGISIYPRANWRVYAESGYAFYSDVTEQWEFQFGLEYAPGGATGFRGEPFVAVNGHLREEVDFGGNFVIQTGWAWRRDAASGMFRLGVEYFNGKSDQFSFFDQSEQKLGFGVWYDY